ncbi:MAG: twin-arginine translocase TatA/TatE family subunit [Chloroflexota bacterium]|nr:MAG: twin-arginine translocase TatA/TatE family subunit [Chloroflexota bacterium]
MIGFWQIAIILYVLFLAVGPRRLARWGRIWSRFLDRMAGRPPRPMSQKPGWLRTIELFEHSSKIGWACVILGISLLALDGVCRQTGCPFTGPFILLLAMLFLFIAPWLI